MARTDRRKASRWARFSTWLLPAPLTPIPSDADMAQDAERAAWAIALRQTWGAPCPAPFGTGADAPARVAERRGATGQSDAQENTPCAGAPSRQAPHGDTPCPHPTPF